MNKGLLDIFNAAISVVTEERGKNYGHPSTNFRRAAALRAIVAECPDSELRHALGAITDKVARLIETPEHLDSWIDVAGYARCGVMILDARAANEKLKKELSQGACSCGANHAKGWLHRRDCPAFTSQVDVEH